MRVDSRGDEHLFQIFERGEQYGIMLGGLGESIPVRIFALEPSTILSLDHEKSMELMLLHRPAPAVVTDLRPQLAGGFSSPPPRGRRSCSRCSTNRRRRETSLRRSSGACKVGEAVSVLSDAESWRSIPDVGFRSLLDGNRLIEVAGFADRLLSGTRPNASSSMSLLLRTWTGPCS